MSFIRNLFVLALAGLSTACAATDIQREQTLSDYDRLVPAERRLIPVREFVAADSLMEVSAIHIPMAGVVDGVVEDSGVDPERFERVAGKLNQTLCRRLARGGFTVTTEPEQASHRIALTITGFETSNPVTAGASELLSFAVPGPISPRIPIGVGALAVEGEMLDREGQQIAAMQWSSRNHLISGGGFSQITDGFALAQVFADGFGDLIVDARDSVDGQRGATERGVCNAMFDEADTMFPDELRAAAGAQEAG